MRHEAAEELMMGQPRSLRPPRRSRGQRDQQRQLAAARARGKLRRRGEAGAPGLVERDAIQAADLRAGFDEHETRAEMAGDARLLLLAPAPVHRQDHEAEPRQRIKQDHVLDRVLQRQADQIALARAEARQRRRLGVNRRVERAVVDHALALYQRRMGRARPGVKCEGVGEVHHGRSPTR